MLQTRYTLIYVALMTLVVVSSNFLVQFPLNVTLSGVNLADLLTWGAFTYPVAFLITDLTNRQFGPQAARKVVFAGFLVGVTLSFFTSVPRIAIASGTAYLAGQLLDIALFNRLRRQAWWRAPLVGSLLGSMLDTAIFFSLSFAAFFVFLGPNEPFALEASPVLGVFVAEAPRWISWAIGDFWVKLLVGLVMLLPYGALMSVLRPMQGARAAS
ncbi:queuosine precursor transporter [Rhizobium sp. 16-449-1b]|uniref:queuosine precursor transporter n=1 Tax=Rhizobium sp. 16-449-1b TaxID=2819989 RepID=UPI001ADCEA76|nr:queuosine precursor transporter [Rhizobium sp. 16-449-1b]MBO9195490.1 queuosine precursor transporter [Rhizobium sp. 16-449-1b]